jgi:hypothetical protein
MHSKRDAGVDIGILLQAGAKVFSDNRGKAYVSIVLCIIS